MTPQEKSDLYAAILLLACVAMGATLLVTLWVL